MIQKFKCNYYLEEQCSPARHGPTPKFQTRVSSTTRTRG